MEFMLPWERTAERRGRKKGMEKGIKQTALRMLDDGLPVETISKYTGLPPMEIKKLVPVTH